MLGDGELIGAIAGGVLLFIVLPLICCCVCCGWCCVGCANCCRGKSKPAPVHIYQQQAAPPPIAPQVQVNTTHSSAAFYPPQAHPSSREQGGFNNNQLYSPQQWERNNSFRASQQRKSYQTNPHQSQNFYPDQRYQPLTEFGLHRNQYPSVHQFKDNPRNYLGQTHYDIYQPANQPNKNYSTENSNNPNNYKYY